MLIDYHSHTTRCNHATGTMQEYVERAIEIGLDEFGFSDHSPWMYSQAIGRKMAMSDAELPEYVADVKRLAEQYDSDTFKVRLGMEMDFIPSRIEAGLEQIKPYDWDYLIGSVHHIGFWPLPSGNYKQNYEIFPPEEIVHEYYWLTEQMIRSRCCDIIGHMDVIVKHGFNPPGGLLPYIEPLIPLIRQQELVVEINTSGLDNPAGAPQPGWEIIEALHAGGVMLMINSDAHAPEHVGRYFEDVVERLRAIGVRELIRFEKRQPVAYELPSFLSPTR